MANKGTPERPAPEAREIELPADSLTDVSDKMRERLKVANHTADQTIDE